MGENDGGVDAFEGRREIKIKPIGVSSNFKATGIAVCKALYDNCVVACSETNFVVHQIVVAACYDN